MAGISPIVTDGFLYSPSLIVTAGFAGGVLPPTPAPPPVNQPYHHVTWVQLQTALSARLADTSQRFWTSSEIPFYLTEALRTFALASGFWRERGEFTTTSGVSFYDINDLLLNGFDLILAPTVTDRDLIQQIELCLLETVNVVSWSGTEMFTQADMAAAVQNRLNQFMSDTGVVVNRSTTTVLPPQTAREPLDQSTIDVRRAAWVGAAPESYYSLLWRDDERMMTSASSSWSLAPGTPEQYSIMATPPLQIQLSPPPIASGSIELLTVDSKALDPASAATVLGIPDNLSPAIKWGALADLLGKDGIARDPVRADFCERRYQQFVQMARLLPVVLHAEINGKPLIASTLAEMDAATPNWQNISANAMNPVQDLVLAAPNLAALSAVPSASASVVMDVVRAAPIPETDAGYVQIGREQIDMILDYAEHLAMFKVGGMEWHATERQADNFLLQSITYNQRISASVRAAASAAFQSERQKTEIPRRVDAWLKRTFGVGAVTIGDN